MDEDSFSVQVFGPGVRVERNVPEHVVYKLLQILLEAGSEIRERRARHTAEDETGRLLRRAFRQHRPRTNAERIALVVVCVERLWERPTRRDEIADWLVLAGESLPANFSRDLSLAQEKQLIVSESHEGQERYVPGPGARMRFRPRAHPRSGQRESEDARELSAALRRRLLRNAQRHSAKGEDRRLPQGGES